MMKPHSCRKKASPFVLYHRNYHSRSEVLSNLSKDVGASIVLVVEKNIN